MNFLQKWLWPGTRERPPPEREPPGSYDLDTPLLYFSPLDAWTIRDACEGVQIFGSIGGGKTSGSGAAIARAFLRAGFGGLVLCAKPEERLLWERYARETGREKQLIIVSPDQPWRFNLLGYELRREGRGARLTENLVNLLGSVVEIVEGKISQTGDSAYWDRGKNELLRNAIDLLSLAKGTIRLDDISLLLAHSPQSDADTAKILAEIDRYKAAPPEERQPLSYFAECLYLADEKAQTTREKHDLEAAVRFWLKSFATLDPRPRSGIISTFSGVADILQHGLVWEILGTETNLTPEVTYKDGAIVVLDFPIQEFGYQVGGVIQQIIKLMFQRAILRRDVNRFPRPVFLWADESQNFISSFDYQYQAVARSARACTVYLTQNINNYYAVLGGGGREAADSLLGLFQTVIFHANGDSATNRWASEKISQERTVNYSFNSGATQQSAGGSQTVTYKLLPAVFTTLRKGGPQNHKQVEAIVFQGGRIWKATGDTYIKSIFHQ